MRQLAEPGQFLRVGWQADELTPGAVERTGNTGLGDINAGKRVDGPVERARSSRRRQGRERECPSLAVGPRIDCCLPQDFAGVRCHRPAAEHLHNRGAIRGCLPRQPVEDRRIASIHVDTQPAEERQRDVAERRIAGRAQRRNQTAGSWRQETVAFERVDERRDIGGRWRREELAAEQRQNPRALFPGDRIVVPGLSCRAWCPTTQPACLATRPPDNRAAPARAGCRRGSADCEWQPASRSGRSPSELCVICCNARSTPVVTMGSGAGSQCGQARHPTRRARQERVDRNVRDDDRIGTRDERNDRLAASSAPSRLRPVIACSWTRGSLI